MNELKRYIDFASGGDHVTKEEIEEHKSELEKSLICDDNEAHPLSSSRGLSRSIQIQYDYKIK